MVRHPAGLRRRLLVATVFVLSACAGTPVTIVPIVTCVGCLNESEPGRSIEVAVSSSTVVADPSSWLTRRPRDLPRGAFENLDGARFAVVTGAHLHEAISLLAEQPWRLLERDRVADFSEPPLPVADDHVLVLLRGVAIEREADSAATTNPGSQFVLRSDDGSVAVRHSGRSRGVPTYCCRPILASLPRPPTRLYVEQVTVIVDPPVADD